MSEISSFIPSRLTEARTAQSETMRALSEKCGLSPTSISAYESGTRVPTSRSILSVAHALEMPFEYFISERAFPIKAKGAVFFRSQASTRTRKEQDKRKQFASWSYEVLTWLGQFVKLPAPDLPDFHLSHEPMEEYEIEEIANKLRSHWELTYGPISNIVTLLENKGIFVIRQPAGTKKLDAFSRVLNGRPVIFLSTEKSSSVRSRFDAAHELGHLILHQHLTQHEISERETLNRIEREANAFASAFLMPEETFSRDLIGVTLNSLQLLKKRWLVSIQALIMRCEHIGAIDYEQKKRLLIQVSSRGWRKKEPLDNIIPIEQPRLAKNIWSLMLENSLINESTILDELKLPKKFIANIIGIEANQLVTYSERNNIIPIELFTKET